MKKIVLCLMLLVLSVNTTQVLAMAGGAQSTASEVPTAIVAENRDGMRLIVKTYTVPPKTDPASLIEEPFPQGGYRYAYLNTLKGSAAENKKWKTETVTVNTASSDLSAVLSALEPSIPYDDGVYSGTLALDHSAIRTEATGYASSSYTVTETKQISGLDRNDPSYVPKATVKGGRTLALSNIEWAVEGTSLAGDSLVASSYTAVATYSGSASKSVATGYVTTARYSGEISGSPDITYQVTYIGKRSIPRFLIAAGLIAATLGLAIAVYALALARNVNIYATSADNPGSHLIGRQRVSKRNLVIDINKARRYPHGECMIMIKKRAARRLYGKMVLICLGGTAHSHLIEQCQGDDYWITISAAKESNYEKRSEEGQ